LFSPDRDIRPVAQGRKVPSGGHHQQEACVVLLVKCGECGNLTQRIGELATLEDFD
jgi:hypothetical protein